MLRDQINSNQALKASLMKETKRRLSLEAIFEVERRRADSVRAALDTERARAGNSTVARREAAVEGPVRGAALLLQHQRLLFSSCSA